MSGRNLFGSALMACLPAIGFLGMAPAVNAQSVEVKPGKIAGDNASERYRRGRGVRIHLPIGPASVYYDYPYYYSRGFYPTHIGGYVYYPYRYYSRYYGRNYRGPGSLRSPRGS